MQVQHHGNSKKEVKRVCPSGESGVIGFLGKQTNDSQVTVGYNTVSCSKQKKRFNFKRPRQLLLILKSKIGNYKSLLVSILFTLNQMFYD